MIKNNSTILFGRKYIFDIDLPAFLYNEWEIDCATFPFKSSNNIYLPPQVDLSNFIGINEFNVLTAWKKDRGKIFLGRYVAPVYIESDYGLIDTECKNFKTNLAASLISTLSIASIMNAINSSSIFLHGTSLTKKDRGIVLLGEAGAGKSTLASYLLSQRGFKIISDDLTIIEGNELTMKNGFQFVKLWPQEIPFFKVTKQIEKIVAHANKVVVPLGKEYVNTNPQVTLSAIFILNRQNAFIAPSFYMIEKKDLLITFLKYTYMKFILTHFEKLNLSKNILKFIDNFSNVYVINIPNDLNQLSNVANIIEELSDIDGR